jgi:hypothetical protein
LFVFGSWTGNIAEHVWTQLEKNTYDHQAIFDNGGNSFGCGFVSFSPVANHLRGCEGWRFGQHAANCHQWNRAMEWNVVSVDCARIGWGRQ